MGEKNLIGRVLLVVILVLIEIINFVHTPRTRFSFSNLGYSLNMLAEVWILVHLLTNPLKEFSRKFWICSQLAWNINTLIVVVYWGYLYHLEAYQAELKKSIILHTEKIVIHVLPALCVMLEMKSHGIEYRKHDFLWTIVYLLCYGVVSLIEIFVAKNVLYPMLTWKDMATALFIPIVFLLAFLAHCLGYFTNQFLHPTASKLVSKDN